MTKRTRGRKKPGWVSGSASYGPDPRVNPKNAEYGKRLEARTVLIDDRQRAYEHGALGLVRLPDPPDEE